MQNSALKFCINLMESSFCGKVNMANIARCSLYGIPFENCTNVLFGREQCTQKLKVDVLEGYFRL